MEKETAPLFFWLFIILTFFFRFLLLVGKFFICDYDPGDRFRQKKKEKEKEKEKENKQKRTHSVKGDLVERVERSSFVSKCPLTSKKGIGDQMKGKKIKKKRKEKKARCTFRAVNDLSLGRKRLAKK